MSTELERNLRKLRDEAQRHALLLTEQTHRVVALKQLWGVILGAAAELAGGGDPFEIAAGLPEKLKAVKGTAATG